MAKRFHTRGGASFPDVILGVFRPAGPPDSVAIWEAHMVFHFLPRQDPFFLLFEEAAANIRQGAEYLQDLVEDFTDVDAKVERIRAVEERGDEIGHRVMDRLNKSFITPIDRQDILAITHSLDDAIDFIDAAASRLALYAVEQPTDASRQFARLILHSAEALVRLTAMLHRKDFAAMREPAALINHAENEGDRLLRSVVAGLFRSGSDPLTVMKWKEIYETLEEATDRFEQIAHLLQGVVVKNT